MTYSITEFHGAVTHFPVAMLIAAALFELGAPLFRKPEWRIVSFWLLVTAVVTSIPSLVSGWFTGSQMFGKVQVLPYAFVNHRLFAFITSGLALVLLLWRIFAKDNLKGPVLGASIVFIWIIAGFVSYTGFLGGQMAVGFVPEISPTPSTSTATTSTAPALDPAIVAQGKFVYQQAGCSGCHKISGSGGTSGPDLTHEAGRNADIAWQVAHLTSPTKVRPNSFMPPYASLGAAKLKVLATYLVSLK